MESWSHGVVEWWSGGVVEWWSGGVVEWWSGGVVEGGVTGETRERFQLKPSRALALGRSWVPQLDYTERGARCF